MIASLGLLIAALSAASADAEPASRPSAYRKDVAVELIYRQQIDDVYFTDWYGRIEKADGAWRDIYFETSDKFVNKGLVRINCDDPEADIDFTLYSVGEYGAAEDARQVTISYGDRRPWADGNYQDMFGETPTIEFYGAALERFCK
ncbi:hypothetical protein SAMN05428974_2675 [Sphingopyxis sp. YR583]|uniref:hypothetical protein n=1 Tax=Sphingopyxis sp. YR583 TaxID=1881047 RepID=UPI0008A7EC7F|nr:hypothetical protein [Sphingopyxis sp. YR583]SEH18442.1 hypothetical protein SAMN05428974_2675 [Sphingopyxis sp. YR583]